MGLFKNKGKTQPDLNPPQGTQNQGLPQPPQQNHSFNDSTYYSSSNASTADSRMNVNQNQQPPQNQNQPRGTTVTTTTTTTTSKSFDKSFGPCMRRVNTNTSIATTTVNPDGTTQTYSHPYTPPTGPPPPAAETIVDQKLPSNAGIPPQTTTQYQPSS